MVQQNWIETKIMEYERDQQNKIWSNEKEKEFQFLLELYHTGRYLAMNKKQIQEEIILLKKRCVK